MENKYLWNKILKYISKRERCEAEIREYIKRIKNAGSRIENEEVDEIVKKLKLLDFLNEERFAHAYINDNFKLKNKGKSRIRQELKNKKIDELTINKYLKEIDSKDEEKKAKDLVRKTRGQIKKLPFSVQKRRLFGRLIRRGFPPKISLKVIDDIIGEMI